MEPIRSLDQLISDLKDQPSRRVAVAAGHDENTIHAAARAASEGIADMILVGDGEHIRELCDREDLDPGLFTVIDEKDVIEAGRKAVGLIKSGEADVLMKGLIGTSDYMRLILDKEAGLLPKVNILSHIICAS